MHEYTSKNKQSSSQSGFVAILATAVMLPIFGLVGLIVDAGRAGVVSSRVEYATKTAALTGVQYLSINELTAEAKADDAFHIVFDSTNYGATLTNLTITTNTSGINPIMTVKAETSLPTIFMQLFEENSLTITTQSKAKSVDEGGGNTSYHIVE